MVWTTVDEAVSGPHSRRRPVAVLEGATWRTDSTPKLVHDGPDKEQGGTNRVPEPYAPDDTPQPARFAAPGVLSEASHAEMAADTCVQEGNTKADFPFDPASKQGYGTPRGLLNALGLPADVNCRTTGTSP